MPTTLADSAQPTQAELQSRRDFTGQGAPSEKETNVPIQSLRKNQPIAGYTVFERIGAGGYGEVWKAEAPGGLAKAIKFVFGYLDDDRAARELKALNRIKEVRHPFLLSLERIEVIDGQLVIVTELADASLKDRFEACKQSGLEGIPREELLVYLRDAADALDYMSENHSLQHLDVKPENLLLVGGRVKVADFGLVKHLHDATASLMGGLTPLYAPPEVFDAQPSLHSDQYSLAIVYQEMLTGVLPFLGTTAAQLAGQHLHAQPRLSLLPTQDQLTIGRALSKDPNDRFGSCREMVECLCCPERHSATSPKPTERSGTNNSASNAESAAITSEFVWSSGHGTRHRQRTCPDDAPAIRQRSAPAARPVYNGPLIPPIGPSITIRDAQPVAMQATDVRLRPTFVVGIGGTAGHVLAKLRQRVCDRFAEAAIPALQMLLLDTDSNALLRATQGDDGAAVDGADILPMPLRRPQDYRNSSKQLSQTTSRRWLYNIPKSQQTEGLRPLGRLALADHADELFERLRRGIAAAVDAEALKKSAESLGQPFRSDSLHVVMVCSISGGTGSGMVLETAYAIRAVLAQLNRPESDICGLLAHWTSRNPAAKDLAIANAFSCLCELQHFSREDRNYPGDPTCLLPPFPTGTPPFDSVYLVHLGEELNNEQLEGRTEELVEYLYQDILSPCAAMLDQCRRSDACGRSDPKKGVALRTFGLSLLGASQAELLGNVAGALAKLVIQCWLGEPSEEDRRSCRLSPTTSTLGLATTKHETGGVTQIHRITAEQASKLGLESAAMTEKVVEVINSALGGELRRALEQLLAEVFAASDVDDPHQLVLRNMDMMLGVRDDDGELRHATVTTLPPAVVAPLNTLAQNLGETVVDWILGLFDQSEYHLHGSRQAAQWLITHLDRLREASLEAEQRLNDQIVCLHSLLTTLDCPDQTKGKLRRPVGGSRQSSPGSGAQFADYLRLRIQHLALYGTRKVLLSLRGRVVDTADKIKDLWRELNKMLVDLGGISSPAPPGSQTPPEPVGSDLRAEIAQRVTRQLPQLALELDRSIRERVLDQVHGLRGLVAADKQLFHTVYSSLRRSARQIVMAAQKQNNVIDLLSPDELTPKDVIRQLVSCVEAARPRLPCGGAKRLMMIVPQKSSYHQLQTVIQQELNETVSVGFNNVGDVVLCCEIEDMPLAHVAATLIDSRQDYAQVAARLHTRNDIIWSPWA